jgi:hypothetical protein
MKIKYKDKQRLSFTSINNRTVSIEKWGDDRVNIEIHGKKFRSVHAMITKTDLYDILRWYRDSTLYM